MNVAIVYGLYIWVTVIHCIFVGATLYFFFGKKLIKNHIFINTLIIAACLAFLEIYWIPLATPLKLSIFTNDIMIQSHFNLASNTNILEVLRPQWTNILLWIIQGIFTNWLFKYTFQKQVKNK